MTALMAEPEVEVAADDEDRCEIVDLFKITEDEGAEWYLKLIQCPRPAKFHITTRCDNCPTDVVLTRLICNWHLDMTIAHPEMSRCTHGHQPIVVRVWPIGGK